MHFLKMNGVADDNQLTQKIKDFYLFYFDFSMKSGTSVSCGAAFKCWQCMPLTAQLSCIGWGKGGLSYNNSRKCSNFSVYFF